jgi:N-acetylglucosaminyldiphosphoundecaprenol N-acetyl-beta-D-mannosaminyltransferase
MRGLDAATGHLQPFGAAVVALLSFAISFVTPYLIGPRLRQLARADLPPGVRPRRQWLISGLSITVAFSLPVLALGGALPEAQAVALTALLAGGAGMVSDVVGLPRPFQAVLAVGIAAVAVASGIQVKEFKPPFTSRMIALGAWSIPASMVWLLAVAYAVVVCRRLPKLTSGMVAIISLTFAAAALVVGPSRSGPAAGLLGLALAAAAAGAARRDYPALGSSAHWAMGFALGAITIVGLLKNTAFLVIGLPLLALGVPVGEATYAAVYGGGRGRPRLAIGERRELLHEALIRTGLSPRRTVLLFQGATAYLCLVAVVLSLLVKALLLIKLALLMAALVVGFVAFFFLARIMSEPQETGEERVDMFGVPIARIGMDQAVARVGQFIAERSPHMIVTSDTPGIVRAREDPEYQEVVRGADMVTADGRGVVWMARVLGLSLRERVAGADLVERICELAAQRGHSVYLVGAQPGVAEEAARALQTRYPGLRVAGTHHGYFAPEEEPEVVRSIAAARPDILFVAFGAPKQERWIRRHQAQIQAPVAIGVGGTFDVLAGRAKRAPEWMQRAGLEWLYRVLREPRRLPRLWALPKLVWMTLQEAWRRR